MEPITTTAIISTIVGYLAKNLKHNKTFDDFTKDFTSATINWIRPLFLRDEKPQEVLSDLQSDPEDKLNITAAEIALAKALKKDESAKAHLEEMYKKLTGQSIQNSGSINQNSSGVNTGTLIQVSGNSNQVNQK
ncbi:MAG TPA: hypothetical protein VGE24_08065 [Emticicia sp.]